jgi:two-component system response regulator PilR (NtrC family)
MRLAKGMPMPSRHLLIVDDEESITFAVRRYFLTRGFQVDCARELEEAEALLVNRRYDVVIADLRLSGVHGAEGLEVVKYVREHCPWARTILLTAYGSPAVEQEALSRGVDAVIRKPKPLPDLAQVVLGLLDTGC